MVAKKKAAPARSTADKAPEKSARPTDNEGDASAVDNDDADEANANGEYDGDELDQLDVENDSNIKEAYNKYCGSLEDEEVVLGLASSVWEHQGRPDDRTPKDIATGLLSLEEILPVYVEGIIGLALEECKLKSPYKWWLEYRQKITDGWFAGIFRRMPQKSMNLRKKNHDFYKMEHSDELKMAACENLNASWEICRLLVLYGRNPTETETMNMNMKIDHEEYARRQEVTKKNVTHRLGYDPELYANEQEAVRMCAPKGIYNFKYLRTFKENRSMKNYALTISNSIQTKGLASSTADETRKLALTNSRLLDNTVHQVEHLMAAWPILLQELQNNSGSRFAPGLKQSSAGDTPKWMESCDKDVLKLNPANALKFETHGKVESQAQKEGRRKRDKILDDYSDMWDNQNLTWTKVPADAKISLCNSLGQHPLNWHPTVSARRIVNYIGKRRAAKKKQDENGGKEANLKRAKAKKEKANIKANKVQMH
jgi:hypothetical protein